MSTPTYELTALQALEAESIHIFREVAAEFERPVLLFSGGKDSVVMLHLAVEGVLAGADPVPGDARRHRAQLPRGARVPRPHGRASSGCGWSSRASQDSIDAGRVAGAAGRLRNPLQTVTLLDAIEDGRLRRGLRRRPPRRGEGPRQGAGLLASATSSASGTRRTSGPSCGRSTTAGTTRASTSGSSRCRTGPSSTSGSYLAAGERRAAVHLLRPRARGLHARRHAAAGQRVHHARARTKRSSTRRCATARSATCRSPARSSRRAATYAEVIAEVAATRVTERGATRADDRLTEAAMEDRKREGYF